MKSLLLAATHIFLDHCRCFDIRHAVQFEIYSDVQRNFRWRLISGDVVVALSPEGYHSCSVCESAILLVKRTDLDTPVVSRVQTDEQPRLRSHKARTP